MNPLQSTTSFSLRILILQSRLPPASPFVKDQSMTSTRNATVADGEASSPSHRPVKGHRLPGPCSVPAPSFHPAHPAQSQNDIHHSSYFPHSTCPSLTISATRHLTFMAGWWKANASLFLPFHRCSILSLLSLFESTGSDLYGLLRFYGVCCHLDLDLVLISVKQIE